MRFHSLYSYNKVEDPTPCAWQLASDLGSTLSLKGKRILAIGARNLVEIDQLRLFGADQNLIIGIDLYSNVPGIIPMDFHALDFDDETFDVVFWAGSFAYAEDPRKAAGEGRRVLKGGGILAIGDTLLGGATAPRLSETLIGTALEAQVREALEEAASTFKTFTIEIGSLDRLMDFFFDSGNDRLLMARNYEPCHANLILIKGT